MAHASIQDSLSFVSWQGVETLGNTGPTQNMVVSSLNAMMWQQRKEKRLPAAHECNGECSLGSAWVPKFLISVRILGQCSYLPRSWPLVRSIAGACMVSLSPILYSAICCYMCNILFMESNAVVITVLWCVTMLLVPYTDQTNAQRWTFVSPRRCTVPACNKSWRRAHVYAMLESSDGSSKLGLQYSSSKMPRLDCSVTV